MKTNVLYISPNFDYSCGVSKHVFINLKKLSTDSDYKLFFITNKGDSLDRLQHIPNLNFTLMNFEKDHKNIFKMITDSVKLYSFCKKNKIHIIHTHHRYLELFSVLVSKITGAKTVTTVHSLVVGLKSLSFRSDRIICVSNAVKKNLIENYPNSNNKITVLYNCIDKFFFDNKSDRQLLRNKFNFNPDEKIILFAGRVNRIKGVDTLINAFIKINRLHKYVKLILLGQIEDINIAEAIKGFENHIFVIPPVNDISEFYQVSDIVVLPSRIDPFPYVMLEAGAMKKPFIGSRTGGIAEFIADGVNGYLFEPGNEVDLADKIKYVIKHTVEAKNAALKLNEKVIRLCNCKEYFQKIISIYQNLIEK